MEYRYYRMISSSRICSETECVSLRTRWMAVFLALLLHTTPNVMGQTFGGWTCTNTILGIVISQGTFTTHGHSPFVSPSDSLTPCTEMTESYEHNVNCTFEYHAAADHHIYVEFSSFALDSDCDADYVELFFHDGTVRRMCGGSTLLYDVFQDNYAKVTFLTNENFRCEGFKAYFFPYLASGFRRRRRRAIPTPKNGEAGLSRVRRSLTKQEEADYVRQQFSSDLSTARQKSLAAVNSDTICSLCEKEGVESCSCTPDSYLRNMLFSLYKYATKARENIQVAGWHGLEIAASTTGGGGGGGGSSQTVITDLCTCR